jgi:hypothetical protein
MVCPCICRLDNLTAQEKRKNHKMSPPFLSPQTPATPATQQYPSLSGQIPMPHASYQIPPPYPLFYPFPPPQPSNLFTTSSSTTDSDTSYFNSLGSLGLLATSAQLAGSSNQILQRSQGSSAFSPYMPPPPPPQNSAKKQKLQHPPTQNEINNTYTTQQSSDSSKTKPKKKDKFEKLKDYWKEVISHCNLQDEVKRNDLKSKSNLLDNLSENKISVVEALFPKNINFEKQEHENILNIASIINTFNRFIIFLEIINFHDNIKYGKEIVNLINKCKSICKSEAHTDQFSLLSYAIHFFIDIICIFSGTSATITYNKETQKEEVLDYREINKIEFENHMKNLKIENIIKIKENLDNFKKECKQIYTTVKTDVREVSNEDEKDVGLVIFTEMDTILKGIVEKIFKNQ